MRKHLGVVCAVLTFCTLILITLQATLTRAEVATGLEVLVKCDDPSCAGIGADPETSAGLAVIILRTPGVHGDFWYSLVEGSTAFVAHPGMQLNLKNGDRIETVYLERYVANSEVASGFECDTLKPWHLFHFCNGQVVTGYWQLTLDDPLH